jgi:glycosyltransferase involved in cell wall biosynthesis
MRVAIFTDNDFAKVNGVTTTLKAVLRYAPEGIEPRIYTAADRAADDPDYFALESIGIPIPYYPEMKVYLPRVRAYIRRAREERIDVIHLTTPGPIGLTAMRVARVLGLPMVGSFHTDLAAYTRILSGSRWLESVMRSFMRWPYRRCDKVLVPSKDTWSLLTDPARDAHLRSGDDPTKIAIWRRGVDCRHFHPSLRSDALRRSWRVSRSVPAILYVGRVSREKGLDLLAQIQECLRQAGIHHRFIVVGAGPMLGELQTRMHDAVFTGPLGRDDVARAFASADVFLFPSRTDTAGNVILEAQASGLPVLVADAGGPRENMVNGTTGAVVLGSAAWRWAEAIADLLRNEDRRAVMSRAARCYGESRSWEIALEPLFGAYRELATNPTASSAVQTLVPNGVGLT